jgi:molecular chaperone GrpE
MTEGVRAVQQGLLAALGAHGVSVIRPAPGDVFNPNQHSAIVQMPGALADGTPIEPGRVSQTLQVGYMLSAHGQDRVIRSAKVGVVPGGA